MKEQSRLKDKATTVDKDVRAPTKKTQYFLTMNGGFFSLVRRRAVVGTMTTRTWQTRTRAVSARIQGKRWGCRDEKLRGVLGRF